MGIESPSAVVWAVLRGPLRSVPVAPLRRAFSVVGTYIELNSGKTL